MATALLQEAPQLAPRLLIGLGGYPLRGVPAVEPEQVAALHEAAAHEVQGRHQQAPVLLVRHGGVPQRGEDPAERAEVHSGRGSARPLAPLGAVLALPLRRGALPDGGAVPQARVPAGPLLEGRQRVRAVGSELLEADLAVAVLVEGLPKGSRVHLEDRLAELMPQDVPADEVRAARPAEGAAQGPHLVPEGGLQVLLEGPLRRGLPAPQDAGLAVALLARHVGQLLERVLLPGARGEPVCGPLGAALAELRALRPGHLHEVLRGLHAPLLHGVHPHSEHVLVTHPGVQLQEQHVVHPDVARVHEVDAVADVRELLGVRAPLFLLEELAKLLPRYCRRAMGGCMEQGHG
mmetsp:Transcript_42198/g.113250  ORF Transcript_42198/g.113250 Transcript_42198/m.113250 type:complete len:349 (-) Transcript_42198:492-1538(-)